MVKKKSILVHHYMSSDSIVKQLTIYERLIGPLPCYDVKRLSIRGHKIAN